MSNDADTAFHEWHRGPHVWRATSEIFSAGWQAHEQVTSEELTRLKRIEVAARKWAACNNIENDQALLAALAKGNNRPEWVWPGQSLDGAPNWVLNFWHKGGRRNRIQFEYDDGDTRRPILVVPCTGGTLVARPGDTLLLWDNGHVTVR
jgi:hypothetical protein